ncbi:MAG: ABC transporter permease subunit [Nocardioides sp.]
MTIVQQPMSTTTTTTTTIPMSRITTTELRKMLDTRSGFWTVAGIGIVSFVATAMVILFADREDLTYRTFTSAINVPISLLLPIIAILSVTAEWSQRSGLTTFTLVPHRSRIIAGKFLAAVVIAVVASPVAFLVGALGNVAGTTIAGVDPVWDLPMANLVTMTLSNVLGMLVGFMLGVLVRSSPGALVAYFVYEFLLPTLALILAANQDWFRHVQPWVDFDFASSVLQTGAVSSQEWVHLAGTGLIWLVVPLAVGLRLVVRAEVK